MRGTGAARRRQEREQDEPDPVAAAVAEIGRVVAESDATQRGLRRHESAIAGIVATLEQLAAGCPDAGQIAVLADKLAVRQSQVIVELIADGAHNAEAREELERLRPLVSLRTTMYEAAFVAGRQAGIAEEQARASRAPRGRHAARKRHLKVAGSIAAGSAVAASLVAGSAVIASQDSAAIGHWSPRPASVRFHEGRPDTAVLVPSSSPRAYVPRHARPSADAATATPAPSPSPPVLASPSPSAPSAPPSPVSSGTVNLQTVNLVIGPSGQARIVFTASGTVQWSASVSGPVSLNRYGGLLGDGQSAVIVVTVQPGTAAGSAVVTITDQDGNATQVPVFWVALPVL